MYIQAIKFSPKSWKGLDGKKLLIPKDEGTGIMISPFWSRVFGFGFAWDDLSDADLNIINDFRAEKAYIDTDDVKLLRNGNFLDKYMSREENNFVMLFEYGNSYNKQGCWSYEHLVLKM